MRDLVIFGERFSSLVLLHVLINVGPSNWLYIANTFDPTMLTICPRESGHRRRVDWRTDSVLWVLITLVISVLDRWLVTTIRWGWGREKGSNGRVTLTAAVRGCWRGRIALLGARLIEPKHFGKGALEEVNKHNQLRSAFYVNKTFLT